MYGNEHKRTILLYGSLLMLALKDFIQWALLAGLFSFLTIVPFFYQYVTKKHALDRVFATRGKVGKYSAYLTVDLTIYDTQLVVHLFQNSELF